MWGICVKKNYQEIGKSNNGQHPHCGKYHELKCLFARCTKNFACAKEEYKGSIQRPIFEICSLDEDPSGGNNLYLDLPFPFPVQEGPARQRKTDQPEQQNGRIEANEYLRGC